MPRTLMGMAARAAFALALGTACLLSTSVAQAHFTLDYPPAWTMNSDSFGDPQKAFPCGVLSTDTYTKTGAMTSFAPGQTITVKWTEEIAHTGWFRISLSYQNGAEFQATTDFTEPTYETDSLMDSVDAAIESPPVAPVLMDGLDKHASGSTPMQYSQDITLPTMPCDKCVLQVIQIMIDNHPINPPNNVPGAGYTYHHCAFISISAGGDGGTKTVLDGGAASDAASSTDASVSSSGSSGSSGSSSGASSSSGAGSSSGTTSSGGSGSTSSGGSTSSSNGGGASNQGGAGGGAADGSSNPASGGSGGSSSGGCSLSRAGVPTNALTFAGLAGLGVAAALARRRGHRRN